jgi:hypothetical protein
MQQRESTRVLAGGFDVDQERIQGCQGKFRLLSLYQRFEHLVVMFLTALIAVIVLESEFENSVRARSVGKSRPVRLLGFPGCVRHDLDGDHSALPLDDWEKPCEGPAVVRSVSTRIAPDRDRLAEFAKTLSRASSPVLICGAVAFAEALGAPVWAAPAYERTPFPENYSPYCGGLPFATRPLSEKLKGHDVALVIGAPVFRYYPYVPGPYLPAGLRLPHMSDDPAETARAPVGDSLIGDAVLTLVGLTALMADYKPKAAKPAAKVAHRIAPHPPSAEMRSSDGRLSAAQVFAALNEIRPTNTVLVEESPLKSQRSAQGMADHRARYLLHLCERGARLEPSRVGRRRACRARQRSQSSGDNGHRRWFISVFGSIDLERRAAASSHVDPRSAERGILHSQIVCSA